MSEPSLAALLRQPHPSELEYFQANPHVAGMAAEDDRVILNPYTGLSAPEQQAVVSNEAARIYMRQPGWQPAFDLTPEQRLAFAPYGPADAQRATIAARLYSGDPSARGPTADQLNFVERLRAVMTRR